MVLTHYNKLVYNFEAQKIGWDLYVNGFSYLGVSKNRGKTSKMDSENNGKPYFLIDDLGGKPTMLETPILGIIINHCKDPY